MNSFVVRKLKDMLSSLSIHFSQHLLLNKEIFPILLNNCLINTVFPVFFSANIGKFSSNFRMKLWKNPCSPSYWSGLQINCYAKNFYSSGTLFLLSQTIKF